MPLDPKFNKYTTASEAVVSFDANDFALKTGTTSYYLFGATTSSGTTYHLSRDAVYSDPVEASAGSATDLDFDLPAFEVTQTARGTAIFSFGWGTTAAAGNYSGTCTARVRKYSGATETTIGTAVSPTFNFGADAGTEVYCLPIVLTETIFAVGDILRVSLYFTISAAAKSGAIGIDPQNRDGTYISPSSDDPPSTSTAIIKMPFKIGD